MSNISITLNGIITDGMDVTFKTPCDCKDASGLKIYYRDPEDSDIVSKVFDFIDTHGNNVSNLENIFAEGVYVKVILDIVNNRAYIQNADTNAYLEGKINGRLPTTGGTMTGPLVLGKIILQRGINYGTEEEMNNIIGQEGQLFFVFAEQVTEEAE